MRAAAGDRLIVRGQHVGDHARVAMALGVEGDDGGPPYLVRWNDDDHQSTFFPGSDTLVEHFPTPGPNT